MPTVPVLLPIVEAGVDYLTMTRRRDGDFRPLRNLAIPWLREQANIGNELTPWRGMGYTGEAAGSVRWGEREVDEILTLSGERAAALWRDALPLATSVSRLDLQVTVQAPPELRHVASRAYSGLCRRQAARRERNANSKEVVSTLTVTPDQGQTLYLGAPKSLLRARLYDKSAESKGERPPGQWRYEIQARKAEAALRGRWLAQVTNPGSAVVAAVYDHFRRRHVAPVFDPAPLEEGMPRMLRSKADAERKADWLSKMVRPTVQELVELYGREYVLALLGFDGEASSRPNERSEAGA
jgi:hypothetical protein